MPEVRPIDRWFIDEVFPHERRYLAAALRLTSDAEDARDIVQEVYLKLFAIDGWAAIDNPANYVLRMIRNAAIERMRRARIVSFQQLAEIETFDIADEAPDPFREAAGRHELRRVKAALDTLPERCRAVVLRRRFSEETPSEIARATGESLSTLEKRLARGMQLLTAALSIDGPLGRKATRKSDIVDADDPVSPDEAVSR
ncbi:RNA polymerase sigma factor [Novosphingobium kaempferiae]|uniref:RNA polymerase sigma factor n=1 Tax=Novosphingobium kaempferiae TaxID=2896849 RepID=UPI001E6100C1|nr:sigma-70 family RNA polymerase sigma factor [Novosphingobium kaempferiae]